MGAAEHTAKSMWGTTSHPWRQGCHGCSKTSIHVNILDRFEQLLHLNSLVLKEESGYRAYFYHLLRPFEHFIPVWKQVRLGRRFFMCSLCLASMHGASQQGHVLHAHCTEA